MFKIFMLISMMLAGAAFIGNLVFGGVQTHTQILATVAVSMAFCMLAVAFRVDAIYKLLANRK